MGRSWNRGWMNDCRPCRHKRTDTETTTGYHGGAVPVTTKYCVALTQAECPIEGWPAGRWDASVKWSVEVGGMG